MEKSGPELSEPTTGRGVFPLLVPGLVFALVCWCFELTRQCHGVCVFPIKTQTEGPYSSYRPV